MFLDYNQNAKDRTVAAAYSVRPRPDARVSAPLDWTRSTGCDPADFTLATMPARVAQVGDRHAAIDDHRCTIEPLLELSARQEREGLGDAPWPPHYRKQAGRGVARRAVATPRPEAPADRDRARETERDDAPAGLERWKARHPAAAAYLQPADVLIDALRGRSKTWTRIRVNLQHVPEDMRPPQEALDPAEDLADDWKRAGVTS